MRRLFAWTAGLVSIAALARLLRRHRRCATPTGAESHTDPAEELRRKLDDARAPATGSPTTEEPPAVDPEPPREPLDERRARVQEKARKALDEMSEDP